MSLLADVQWIWSQLVQRTWMLRGNLAILTYHRVCERGDHGFLQTGGVPFVTPAAFAEQVRFLAAGGFDVVALDDAMRRRERGERFARRTVAITFDDGYRDNLDAARVLHAAGLPATVFVATDCLRQDALLCEHRLFLAIERLGEGTVRRLLADLVPGHADRRFAWWIVWRMPGDRRTVAHERLGAALRDAGVDEAALCRALYLSPADLPTLRRLGIAVGSHGARHHPWTTMTSAERAADLAAAGKALHLALGDDVAPWFASPYGSHRRADRDLLRAHGCLGALSTRFGGNGRGTDRLRLRRIAIGDTSFHRLAFLQRSARLARCFDGL